MNPTGGYQTGSSPDAVQKAINAVIYEKYMRDEQPDAITARDPFFFKQSLGNEMVYVWDEDSNVGAYNETEEQEDVADSNTFIGNQKTVRQRKWMKQVPISFEAMQTEQEGINKRNVLAEQMGDRAKSTQDKTTLQDTYGDAFTGSISTTPDGDAWASDSHTTLTGVTVDNLETVALSADGLWTVVQSHANQKAQDGEGGGQLFEGILTPFRLLKTAHETLDSDLNPNGGENAINFFKTVYGAAIRIAGTIILDSTYNSATNAATSYHVCSRNVNASRKVLVPLTNKLILPEMTKNDTYAERSKYMESHFVASWFGSVHSNGTTS